MPAVTRANDGRKRARAPKRGMPHDPLIRVLVATRLEQKVTLSALSRRLGYHLNTLADWESERSKPSVRALTDWANGLGFELRLVTLSAEQSTG